MRKFILTWYDKIRRKLGMKCHDCRSRSACIDYGCNRECPGYEDQWWMKY